MARTITANDIAKYMLKAAMKARCVEFKLDDFQDISLDSLRTRLYANKRGAPEYEIFRVAMGVDYITVVNIEGDEVNLVVTKAEVEASIERHQVKGTTKTDSEISCSLTVLNINILGAFKTLVENGIISSFVITGCDSLVFKNEYPNSGFVIKDTANGIRLF